MKPHTTLPLKLVLIAFVATQSFSKTTLRALPSLSDKNTQSSEEVIKSSRKKLLLPKRPKVDPGSTNNNTGGGSTNLPPPVPNAIQLPIEVLGEDQHTEEVKLVLNDNPSDVFGIKLQVHNLGFTNKMAISVNNSPWVTLNNRNVDYTKQFDKAMYGMGGGHNTLSFVVPFASNNIIPSVTNIVRFRFNDINRETVGYRILDVDLVKAQPNGYELNYVHIYAENPVRPTNWGLNTNLVNKYIALNLSTIKDKVDPSKWVPISTDASIINKGKELWYYGNLTERGVAINAKCTDCHATDGYDLKYFNYSDKSIVARSKYHGLNNDDSVAIASYIRSLNVPYQEKGRPWNPPYQPGPGIDSKPVSSWAAGAGIEAIADYDLQTYKALFPNGVDGGIKYDDGLGPIDFGKSLNMREIPIVIQFPDWKDWLPRHHVKDVAPDVWEYVTKIHPWRLPTYFENALTQYKPNDSINNLRNLYWSHQERIGYTWVHIREAGILKKYAQVPNNIEGWENVTNRNIIYPAWHHYVAVRHWEIMNKLGLQEIGHEMFNPNNKDQWNNPLWKSGYGGHDPVAFENKFGFPITKAVQNRRWYDTYTFHLAPHIMGNVIIEDMSSPLWNKLTWGTKSFMWYQLQMILDDTNKTPDRNIVDWGYLFALSWSPATHGTSQYDLLRIRSWGVHFLNTLKADEAYFVNAGKQNNEISLEGRYFPPRGQSDSLGGRAEPWDGRTRSDSIYTFLVFSAANAAAFQNPEQRDYITKSTAKLIDAEIDFMSKFDAAYLIGQGMSTQMIDNWEAGLRYAGGDDDNKTLEKVTDFRTRLFPNYTFLNKYFHVYPDPWPNLK
jgi:hypothetical protein